MRYSAIDESKIIKKNPAAEQQNNQPTNIIEENIIEEECIQEQEVIEKPIVEQSENIKEEIIKETPIKESPKKEKTVVKNQTKNIPKKETVTLKEEQPVFVFTHDENKNIVTQSKVSTILEIDIPSDQLRLIYINTDKLINELKLDILLIKNKLMEGDSSFYKNKLDYLQKELDYNIYKKEELEKMIENTK